MTSPFRAATPRCATTRATYRAHDIGSLNGTYLNRERIDTASLASGDELQVGKFRLLFLAPGHGPGAGHAAGTA